MKKNSAGFSTIFLIVIIAAIVSVVVVYYIVKKNTKIIEERLIVKQNQDQKIEASLTKLEESQLKLKIENEKLSALKERADTEKKLNNSILIEYTKTQKMIESQIDILFKNGNTNPELKIKLTDPKKITEINAERKKINTLLSSWKNKINEYNKITDKNSKIVNSSLSQKELNDLAKNNISQIQKYIQELNQIINELDKTNSALTNSEIISYQNKINNSEKEIDKIVDQINSLTEKVVVKSIPNTPINIVSIPSVVTPQTIIKQEEVVKIAEEELSKIAEEELSKIAEEEAKKTNTPIEEIPENLDTVLPSVSITNPDNLSNASYVISISASASDNEGVEKIEFYNDGVLFDTDTNLPYNTFLDTTGYSNGYHTITAKAYDTSGNIKISNGVLISVLNDTTDQNFKDPNAWAPDLIEGSNNANY